MGILNFDKPKKVSPTKEHNDYFQSDSGVAGTYVPNMSEADLLKWKAKKIGGTDPRVEIRKTVKGHEPGAKYPMSAQVLMVVRPNRSVVMSANGRMVFGPAVFDEFQQAVAEAVIALQ